ncbi:siroheme synthase [Altererythrobacter soli]|uniref:precorrin-2 dehydrogenase n=1 Tax=Croceibacterium soli TaxID=1739690 RepID=A0A6I4UR33_9SPHN|nr:bifunctional precorrin-2 dehydrogenase/sirohydrochlorin ferrochelatase [Croceibacterium soli]MXP41450.1 siroheme synthase [Croceibacterium soli]
MKSLPLFHRVAGQPVIVLGEGPAAEAKRRLVARAGGEVVTDAEAGIARGARLAFVATDNAADDAARLRAAGLLVNVVDRPELCDFTTPSILDRDPVLIAIGTGGASAGLAKHLRLRLEAIVPESLGLLARSLAAARGKLRERWPDAADRRRALDGALGPGGELDPLAAHDGDAVAAWLGAASTGGEGRRIEFALASDDPGDLTLRQLQALGAADAILFDPAIPPAILDRARADAERFPLPHEAPLPEGLVIVLHRRSMS